LILAVLAVGSLAAQETRTAPPEPKAAQAPQVAPAPKAKKAPAPPAKAPAKKAPPVNYNVGEADPQNSRKPAPKAAAKDKAKPSAKGKVRARTQKLPMSQRIDVNSASKEELKKLPGIFDAEAEKIMAHRPYKGKEDLFLVAGLTGAQYFAIKDRVKAVPKAGK
jgi:DNA uptake protein ComE-like DNA-binding protein